MQVCAYLTFPGTAEAAMTHYASALGGTLDELNRYSGMPGSDQMPEEARNLVMHVTLRLPDGQVIMASDAMEGMGPPHQAGNNLSISIHPDTREQADQFFAALSDGGVVTMPLEDQFWGDYFGACIDKFGIQWMINFNEQGV